MLPSFTRRNFKFLVFGLLAVAVVGVGIWNWQRQDIAERKRLMEDEARHMALEREGRERRAWRMAQTVMLAADRIVPNLPSADIWRAAQLDAARNLNIPVSEMLRDLDLAFTESQAAAENAPTSKRWLTAGDIGYALYRLEAARTCYQRSHAAPDANVNPGTASQAEERAAQILHELGACEQESQHWKFAFAVGGSSSDPGKAIQVAIRLGRCSQALRREEDALNALHSGLARAENLAGRDGKEIIVPLGRMLAGLTAFRKFPEAESAAQRLMQLSETHVGKESYETGLSLLLQCELFYAEERWAELAAVSQRTVDVLRKTAGEEHPAMLAAQCSLGTALLGSNRLEEAETVCRNLLERAEKCLPRDHDLLGVVTGQLAQTVSAQDRKAEAEGLFRGSVDILEKSGHAAAGDNAASFGHMLASMHRTEEAEAMLRRALAIVTKAYGPGHPKVARAYGWLAELLRNTGRVAEADEMMKRSAQVLANLPAASAVEDRVTLLLGRSDALKNEGRFAEAEADLREALAIGTPALSADHLALATVANNLGLLLIGSDRPTEAERLFRQALETHLKTVGPNHNLVADNLVNLAGIANARGQAEEALSLSRRALEIYEVSYGKEHPRVAIVVANVAYFLLALRRHDEAENAQRRSVQVSEKCFGAESAEVATRLNFLSVILQSAGRYQDAEPVLRRSLHITAKTPQGAEGQKLMNAVSDQYARCLAAMGKEPDAIARRVRAVRSGEAVGEP